MSDGPDAGVMDIGIDVDGLAWGINAIALPAAAIWSANALNEALTRCCHCGCPGSIRAAAPGRAWAWPKAEEASEVVELSRERERVEPDPDWVTKEGEAGTFAPLPLPLPFPLLPLPLPLCAGAGSRTMVWSWVVICSVAISFILGVGI